MNILDSAKHRAIDAFINLYDEEKIDAFKDISGQMYRLKKEKAEEIALKFNVLAEEARKYSIPMKVKSEMFCSAPSIQFKVDNRNAEIHILVEESSV